MAPDGSRHERSGRPSGSDGDAADDVVPDAWWPAGSGLPRLLFLARLRTACAGVVTSRLETVGVARLLGASMSPIDLLHQSLSDRYRDTAEIRRRLLRAGDGVRAQAFSLSLDRLRCAPNERGSRNVELWMKADCEALTTLVTAINDGVCRQGLPRGGGHRPHMTVSYTFHGRMPSLQRLPEVEVSIDAFELVVGGGKPYRYETLRRWMLSPASPSTSQPTLF
jgi:hypothetical protein